MEDGQDRITREIEILGLRRAAAEAAGHELTSFEAEDTPLEVQEAFWRNVVAFETSPWTTHRDELADDGIEPLHPDQLADEHVPEALWSLIRAMADRRIYLEFTDHLTDRELYAWLWSEGLAGETKALPRASGWNRHLSPIGSGSEEDNLCHMRYFADEAERAHWMASFPDYEMPDHQDPPCDRDRFLPKPVYDVYEFEGEDEDAPDDLE